MCVYLFIYIYIYIYVIPAHGSTVFVVGFAIDTHTHAQIDR